MENWPAGSLNDGAPSADGVSSIPRSVPGSAGDGAETDDVLMERPQIASIIVPVKSALTQCTEIKG